MTYFMTFISYLSWTQSTTNFCMVSFDTTFCAWLCILWYWSLLMLIMLIVLICVLCIPWFILRNISVSVSTFLRLSSILLDIFPAFSIAFAISSVLFSVRLVFVINHSYKILEVQLDVSWSVVLSSVLIPYSQCKASSRSWVTNCSILSLNFCSSFVNYWAFKSHVF